MKCFPVLKVKRMNGNFLPTRQKVPRTSRGRL